MYTGNLHKDLKVLLPHIVADGVSYEHSEKLVKLAEYFYSRNEQFGRSITDSNKGLDTLYAFMRHWFDAFVRTGRWIDERRLRTSCSSVYQSWSMAAMGPTGSRRNNENS